MINPKDGWFFWAIGPKKSYDDDHSYNDKQLRGVCQSRTYNGRHNTSDFDAAKFGNCEVDMLLDLDKKEFKLCIVGKLESDEKYTQEAILYDIEVLDGLVPHFNFDSYKKDVQKIQVAKVPIEWYGKEAIVDWDKGDE